MWPPYSIILFNILTIFLISILIYSLQKDLNEKYSGLNDKLSKLPNFNDLDQALAPFVTWPGLEDALKGIRLDFENLQPVTEERVVIELATQTETPVSGGQV